MVFIYQIEMEEPCSNLPIYLVTAVQITNMSTRNIIEFKYDRTSIYFPESCQDGKFYNE